MSHEITKQGRHLSTARVRSINRRKRKFLEALSQTGTVAHAAKMAGVDPSTAWRWRQTDDELRAAWDALAEQLGAVVENALLDRAVNGVEKTVYFRGEPVGVERQYSDAGAMALLRGLRPDRYRESGGVNVAIGNFGIAVLPGAMPDEKAWERMAADLTATQNRVAAQTIDGEAEVTALTPLKRA